MLELAVLSGIVNSVNPERSIELVQSKTIPSDFSDNTQSLYTLLLKRYEAKKDISLVTLLETERHGLLGQLTELSAQRVTQGALAELAEKLHQEGQRRRFAQLGELITTTAKDDKFSASELLTEIDTNILAISKAGVTEAEGPELWTKEMRLRSIRNEGAQMLGPSTGFPSIDEASKGLQAESYWIIGGETNVGKSMAMQKMVLSALKENHKCLVLSLELSNSEMGYRFASMYLKRSMFELRTTRLDSVYGYSGFVEFVSSKGLYFSDSATTIDDVVYQIKSSKRKLGVSVVVVDYLQNVKVPKAKGEYDSLNEVTLTLQRLSKAEQLCVIGVSQVNRETAKGDVKSMYGLKGSGNLENSADIAIVLSADGEDEGIVNMKLVKNRLFGLTRSIQLEKDVNTGKLEEIDEKKMGGVGDIFN